MRFFNKLRTTKTKLILFLFVIINFYFVITYILLEWFAKDTNSKAAARSRSVNLTYVVMHIDLKGTPLKLSYLKTLLPLLKNNGVNGLLIEYEDMFPYEGMLVNLSSENCYKKEELKQFLSIAVDSGFEIVPLVQTFGHLEYALKLPEFQHLREEHLYPDSICPSRKESMDFIGHLLKQIIDFHNAIKPIKYIHIGCDEVFHINKCQHCLKRNIKNTDIFLHHVRTLSDVIKSQYTDMTVLIWDDMLRQIKGYKWDDIDKFGNVQPVCWDYQDELQSWHTNLFKYHHKFQHIWIASAYKGADGRTATFPNLRKRFENLCSWLSLILYYKFGGENHVYTFKGIILTGWSRYSHMDPPCELLPVSMPSLILNLLVIQKFKSGVNYNNDFTDLINDGIGNELIRTMGCVIDIDNVENNSECKFKGKELHESFRSWIEISKNFDDVFNDDELGLRFVDFYSKYDLINKNTLSKNMEWVHNQLHIINYFEQVVTTAMTKYYESDFITEYINYKTYYMKNTLQSLQNIYHTYQNVSTWKRILRNDTYLTTSTRDSNLL